MHFLSSFNNKRCWQLCFTLQSIPILSVTILLLSSLNRTRCIQNQMHPAVKKKKIFLFKNCCACSPRLSSVNQLLRDQSINQSRIVSRGSIPRCVLTRKGCCNFNVTRFNFQGKYTVICKNLATESESHKKSKFNLQNMLHNNIVLKNLIIEAICSTV